MFQQQRGNSKQYFWDRAKDIEDYTWKCVSCQNNKHTVPNTKRVTENMDTPYATCDKMSTDCMGPLPLTEQGNKHILSSQDQLSNYLIVITIPN